VPQNEVPDYSLVIPDKDADEKVGNWEDVTSELIDPEEAMTQDIVLDSHGLAEQEGEDSNGIGDGEVVIPDIWFSSACPVRQRFHLILNLTHLLSQQPCQLDSTLCDDLHRYIGQPVSVPSHHQVRVFSHDRYDGRCIQETFSPKELEIMGSSVSRLNDDCINGISKLLQYIFSEPTNPYTTSSSRCALFSTHDLLMVRYSASNEEIWRRTHGTEFWRKDIWILPIHRRFPAEHWVMAIICPHSREIFCFDSFAETHPWKRELKVC
jgi:hypothetical protein